MFRLEQAGQVTDSNFTFEILTCPYFQTSFLLHDRGFQRHNPFEALGIVILEWETKKQTNNNNFNYHFWYLLCICDLCQKRSDTVVLFNLLISKTGKPLFLLAFPVQKVDCPHNIDRIKSKFIAHRQIKIAFGKSRTDNQHGLIRHRFDNPRWQRHNKTPPEVIEIVLLYWKHNYLWIGQQYPTVFKTNTKSLWDVRLRL